MKDFLGGLGLIAIAAGVVVYALVFHHSVGNAPCKIGERGFQLIADKSRRERTRQRWMTLFRLPALS